MWQFAHVLEGILIGAGVAWFRWRCPRRLLWRFVAGLVVLACISALVGCATLQKPGAKPENAPAMRWQGACEICRVTT